MGDFLQSRPTADKGQFSKHGSARFFVAAIHKSLERFNIALLAQQNDQKTVSPVVDQMFHGLKSLRICQLLFFQ